jgi:hypothetical protein
MAVAVSNSGSRDSWAPGLKVLEIGDLVRIGVGVFVLVTISEVQSMHGVTVASAGSRVFKTHADRTRLAAKHRNNLFFIGLSDPLEKHSRWTAYTI